MEKLASIERNSDGCLPRMTPRQRQAAVKLIRSICNNYDHGNCLLLDITCCQCISYTVNCKIFRWVLLEDIDGLKLKTELFRDNSGKRCLICCKEIYSKSNNAKYCPDCAKNVQRKQKASHARKRRAVM